MVRASRGSKASAKKLKGPSVAALLAGSIVLFVMFGIVILHLHTDSDSGGAYSSLLLLLLLKSFCLNSFCEEVQRALRDCAACG